MTATRGMNYSYANSALQYPKHGVVKVHLAGSETGPGTEFDDLLAFTARGEALAEHKLCCVDLIIDRKHECCTKISHIHTHHTLLDKLEDEQRSADSAFVLRFWSSLRLEATEYITGISGSSGYIYANGTRFTSIDKLIFRTTHGRSVVFGSATSSGCPFNFEAPPNHCVTGFYGRIGHNLNMLGVYLTGIILKWSEELHALFPPSFKDSVRTFLLVCKRHESDKWVQANEEDGQRFPFLSAIPCAVLHLIFHKLKEATFSPDSPRN